MREGRFYMLKMVGSILIIGAGTCIGFLKGNEMAERVSHMQEIKRIFHALEQEITYTRVPLGQAFMRVSERCGGPFLRWLHCMTEMLDTREEGRIEGIWKHATKQHLKETKLSLEDIGMIASQGTYMGQLDVKMQSSTIGLFMEQWEERINQAKAQLESKRKLARCVGLLGGIFLVILLL